MKRACPAGLALSILLAMLSGAGCTTTHTGTPPEADPKPSYLVLLPNADGTVGRVWLQGTAGTQEIAQAGFGALLDGSQSPAPVNAGQLQRDFGAALAARPELPQHYVLYFESGSTQISAQERSVLARIVADAARRKSADVDILGHTDSVGSPELNEGLSLRRAQVVADVLRAMGLKADALGLYGMGQRAPLVGAPHERPEPRNRRVEVIVR